jgi:uncharacterized protein YjdB
MKKLIAALLVLAIVPFALCACDGFNFFSKEIEGITLSQTELNLTVGDTSALTAEVTPEDANSKKLSWTSSNLNVATVDDGEIKAKKSGTAEITVTAENGVKAVCSVTVSDKAIEELTLNNTSASVKVGSKIQLTASVSPADAPKGELSWSSSDEKIALVNSDGYVTGVSEGVANITCKTENGKQASCTVTVKTVATTSATSSTDSTNSTNSTTPTKNSSSSSSSSSSGNSTSGGYIFADSSTRRLTDSEVSGLSSSQVQEAINEIYARNGYVFKTDSIQSYFESKSWYHADSSFSTSDLNEIESYNIGLLSKYR